MSKEAIKLALEALNSVSPRNLTPLISIARITLRKALASEAKEPVAFVPKEALGTLSGGTNHVPATLTLNEDGGKAVAVFLSSQPEQRKPLTDKQILADETLRYYFGQNGGAGPVSKQGRKVVDAIEAAHNIKENT